MSPQISSCIVGGWSDLTCGSEFINDSVHVSHFVNSTQLPVRRGAIFQPVVDVWIWILGVVHAYLHEVRVPLDWKMSQVLRGYGLHRCRLNMGSPPVQLPSLQLNFAFCEYRVYMTSKRIKNKLKFFSTNGLPILSVTWPILKLVISLKWLNSQVWKLSHILSLLTYQTIG